MSGVTVSAAVAGRKMDALVAEAMGWRAWKEKRGEYSLCVAVPPGAEEPWRRSRNPETKRYTAVTCAEANQIGFYGTGWPRFSEDIAAAWLAVEWLCSLGFYPDLITTHSEGALQWKCVVDRYTNPDDALDPWPIVARAATAPLAICVAAIGVMEVAA